MKRSWSTRLSAAAAAGAVAVASLIAAGTAEAEPRWAVDKANAKTKRGVVAAINAAAGTSTPRWCYTVLTNRSSGRWATFQFSAKAARDPQRCHAHDGSASFYYRKANGRWVYAGDGPGWRKTKCKFTVEPSASVARDFGCRWWKVVD